MVGRCLPLSVQSAFGAPYGALRQGIIRASQTVLPELEPGWSPVRSPVGARLDPDLCGEGRFCDLRPILWENSGKFVDWGVVFCPCFPLIRPLPAVEMAL